MNGVGKATHESGNRLVMVSQGLATHWINHFEECKVQHVSPVMVNEQSKSSSGINKMKLQGREMKKFGLHFYS